MIETFKTIADSLEAFSKNYENIVNNTFLVLAVFLGGIVTYYVTMRGSRKDIIIKERSLGRDAVIIPLCAEIESLIERHDKEEHFYIFEKDELMGGFKNIKQYLQANRRLYLNEAIKKLLNELSDLLEKYKTVLISSREKAIHTTMEIVEKAIIESGKHPSFMHTLFGRVEKIESIVDKMLMSSGTIQPLNLLSGVILIVNDDFENTKQMNFGFSEKVTYAYSGISSGYVDVSDFGLNDYEEASLELYDYLMNYFDKKKEQLYDTGMLRKDIIMNSDTILSCLKNIQKECEKEIDSVRKI